MRMTEYLIWMGGSALAAAIWFGGASVRRWGKDKGIAAGGLSLLMWLVLGAVGAKLGYMLLRADLLSAEWIGRMVRNWDPDLLSYYGGAAGVCLGTALTAKLLKIPIRDAMNTFAPMGALLAGLARFGEGFLGMLGVGQYLEESFFPIAVRFTWDGEWFEYYLAVFLFEEWPV